MTDAGVADEHGSGFMPLVDKPFHTYRLQTRILLSQLPLSLTVAVVLLPIAIAISTVFESELFQVGMLIIAIVTVLSGGVPWDRLPYGTYLVLPLLDFLAVGAIIHGAAPQLTGLNLLLVFPVLWLAWSSILPRVMCLVSFLVPALILYAPLMLGQVPVTSDNLIRPLLVPVMTFGLAVAATYVNREMESQQEQLRLAGELSRRRERLVEAIVDAAEVGVLAIDADGRSILKNRRQRKLEAMADPLSVHGVLDEARVMVFAGPERAPIPVAERPLRRAARGERFTAESIWLGNGPDARALNVSARPMVDDAGEFAGSVIVFQDVTALAAALAAQDEFVAGISHEFRTPLTSIIGFTDILLDDAPEDGDGSLTRHSLEVVQRNAERLLGLVNDLLGTAQGTVEVAHEEVDLAAVVRDGADSAAPQAAAAGLTLTVEVIEETTVLGDQEKLCQVLDNLLSNAVKYTVEGGVVVRSGLRDGFGFMEVEDTGPGMTGDEQRRLFERFYRTESARASTIPGNGLGMAVVRAIVDGHGGELIVDSEPGRGTRMTVLLPLTAAAVQSGALDAVGPGTWV